MGGKEHEGFFDGTDLDEGSDGGDLCGWMVGVFSGRAGRHVDCTDCFHGIGLCYGHHVRCHK